MVDLNHQVGISFDIRGVIHRACKECGGVNHPDSRCPCGTEPEEVPVTLHFNKS